MNVKGISYNISSKWVSDMYIIFADLYKFILKYTTQKFGFIYSFI